MAHQQALHHVGRAIAQRVHQVLVELGRIVVEQPLDVGARCLRGHALAAQRGQVVGVQAGVVAEGQRAFERGGRLVMAAQVAQRSAALAAGRGVVGAQCQAAVIGRQRVGRAVQHLQRLRQVEPRLGPLWCQLHQLLEHRAGVGRAVQRAQRRAAMAQRVDVLRLGRQHLVQQRQGLVGAAQAQQGHGQVVQRGRPARQQGQRGAQRLLGVGRPARLQGREAGGEVVAGGGEGIVGHAGILPSGPKARPQGATVACAMPSSALRRLAAAAQSGAPWRRASHSGSL